MNFGRILVVASVILVTALVILTILQMERVEYEVQDGPRGEARTNPVLAAERFLTRMGLPTTSVRDLEAMPPADAVLVLAVGDRIVTEARAARLMDWVAAGGLLVMSPHLMDGSPTAETDIDPLLEELGVVVLQPEDPQPERRKQAQAQVPGTHLRSVRFSTRHSLLLAWEDDETKVCAFLDGTYGDGGIIVLNDMLFMSNDEIGDLEHADFLWQLMGVVGDRTEALIVYGQERLSLVGLLLRHAWPAVLVAVCLLIAVVWRRAARFGPVLTPPPRARRSLMEHVEAAGNFLWRHHRHDVLVKATRQAALSKALARRPGVAKLEGRRRAEALAQGTGLSAKRIASALAEDCPPRRDALTRSIRILEALRRSL